MYVYIHWYSWNCICNISYPQDVDRFGFRFSSFFSGGCFYFAKLGFLKFLMLLTIFGRFLCFLKPCYSVCFSCILNSGVNKHFQMLFIHEKINSSSSRKIAAKDIWDHLNSMYDLQALVILIQACLLFGVINKSVINIPCPKMIKHQILLNYLNFRH